MLLTRLRLGHCVLASGLALVEKQMRSVNTEESETVVHTIMLLPSLHEAKKMFVKLEKFGLESFSEDNSG